MSYALTFVVPFCNNIKFVDFGKNKTSRALAIKNIKNIDFSQKK